MIAEWLALALSQAAPPVPPPPPISVSVEPRDAASDEWLYSHEVGKVSCSGAEVGAVVLALPYPSTLRREITPTPFTLEFQIDADGRPFSIRAAEERRLGGYDSDAMPSLRASRILAANAGPGPRADCRVTYTPVVKPMADATLDEVARLGVAPRGRMSRANWARLGGAGGCVTRGLPARLLKTYPDFREVAGSEGSRDWNYVRFDINEEGETTNVEVAYSSGDADLDRQGVQAVRQDRFIDSPRTGCIVNWWKNPQVISAPDIPDESEFAANETCEIDERWEVEPKFVYPNSYRRRAIEGWAILRFDVAPWGEIGEIEVLAAEPSEQIGEAAMNVIRRAKFKPMAQGLSGCVDRVIFRMSSDAEDEASED